MRSSFAAAAAVLASLLLALPAHGAVVEVGQTATPPVPSCPGKPCFAVSQTTGYQVKAGEQRALTVVPADGRIVAWSIALAKPEAGQQAFFAEQFGGKAQAAITVLRPGRRLYARAVATSPLERLEAHFGTSVQFPLERTLEVKKGWIVALTVPTWAPALAVGAGNDTSWRAASRAKGACDDLDTQVPQTRAGRVSRYRCLFRTARLAYSATLVTRAGTPAPGAAPSPTPSPTPTASPTPSATPAT